MGKPSSGSSQSFGIIDSRSEKYDSGASTAMKKESCELTRLDLQLISPDNLARTRFSKFKLNEFLQDKEIKSGRDLK